MTAPLHMQQIMCDEKCKTKNVCNTLRCKCKGLKIWFEQKPPLIWMPNFELAAPDELEESTEEDFMTIQNVRSFT